MSGLTQKTAALLKRYRIKEQRSRRIERIGKKLTERFEIHASKINKPKKPLCRKEMSQKPKIPKLIAYDLETTRIKKGTPQPLYITAFSLSFACSAPVSSIDKLGQYLVDNFLIEENKGSRFIAWNGNRFDVYFVAAALLNHPEYTLRPYLTRTKNLRGLKVIYGDPNDKKNKMSWEFLDGMSMTGSVKPLKDFLQTFAPEFGKLEAPNWEKEEFNPKNPQHVAYAERDSEGLYHAMMKAQAITLHNFNIGLKPTIGNMGIRIFQSYIPEGVTCYEPPFSAIKSIRDYGMRGGFCYCVKKFQGKIWKYDLNQAYAAAMRETPLPQGRCFHLKEYFEHAKCAMYRVSGAAPRKNKVPFYYRDLLTGKSVFGIDGIGDTWITSTEYAQLMKEGWRLKVSEGWGWEDTFKMKKYVDTLEQLRIVGPKTAQGEMIKAVGNNSYGKTVEHLEGIELVMAKECPEGYYHYQAEDDLFQHIWFKFNKPQQRDYHQPQIGMFITAHVRMQVRRAALTNQNAWLYADTDCVVFSEAAKLPIHSTLYGYWKAENEGDEFRIIAKKVYADIQAIEKHAKGMNIKRLTESDFAEWYAGNVPIQTQVHRNNFIKVMTGHDMFLERVRKGTAPPVFLQ